MAKVSTPHILHRHCLLYTSPSPRRNVLTQSLISDIKQGRLKKDDEISADEKNWVRLDRHYQLASYFSTKNPSSSGDLPPDVEKHLSELSQMLKELS